MNYINKVCEKQIACENIILQILNKKNQKDTNENDIIVVLL